MSTEPTTAEKLRALPWSIAGWAANSVYVQLTFLGSVFVLFLSELGLSKSRIGDLLSFVPFTAVIALAIAPRVARIGYKRVFLTFFAARKVATVFMLFTPWVLARHGTNVGLIYVTVVVAVFSICRAVAMTAQMPWTQEHVPDTVRGKYSAVNQAMSTASGFLALAAARYVIDHSDGLNGFILLIGIGLAFGVVGVWLLSFVPGGGPDEDAQRQGGSIQGVKEALRDADFVRYLIGVALVVLNVGPVSSFLPLFLREEIGLSSGNTVWLQSGSLIGGLISGYLWGWAADRYGSKPIMMSGLYVRVGLPLCWLLIPHGSAWSLHVALGISFIDGLVTTAWAVGSGRLLYTSLVPRERRSSYTAIYYGWVGLVGGLSRVVSGRLLDLSAGLSGTVMGVTLSPYLILFTASCILGLIGLIPLSRLRAESLVGVREFAGMFLQGNPLLAMGSLVRYHRAKDEQAVVSTTESLGRAKSPLTVDELLEALSDPRFNVRFEAIISIARMTPDDRLVEALIDTLQSPDPAFSVMAAWGLGRMGDPRAIGPLREALSARYRSVRGHSARSLGTLGDQDIEALLLERLASEGDEGLQVAYSSALGKFGTTEATELLLDLLLESQDGRSRMELALALARMVGEEHLFIALFRHRSGELGPVAAQVMVTLRERITQAELDEDDELLHVIAGCHSALESEALPQACASIRLLIPLLPPDSYGETARVVLSHCAERLADCDRERLEYLFLALHVIDVGWQMG